MEASVYHSFFTSLFENAEWINIVPICKFWFVSAVRKIYVLALPILFLVCDHSGEWMQVARSVGKSGLLKYSSSATPLLFWSRINSDKR